MTDYVALAFTLMVGVALGFVGSGLMSSGKIEDYENRLQMLRLTLLNIRHKCITLGAEPDHRLRERLGAIDAMAGDTLAADRTFVG